jgi:hypothetical protein
MAIGDKVRAAQEAKARAIDSLDEGAEQPDDERVSTVTRVEPKPKAVFGSLTAGQIRDLVAKGLQIADVKSLADAGIGYDEIAEIADAQARTLALAKSGSDGPTETLIAMQQQNATFMEKVLERARSRRPESYNGDFPFPNISAFAPEGLAHLPGQVLPPLKCPMFLGVWDAQQNKAVPVYPYIADDYGGLSIEERRLLNNLQPGVFTVERRDEIVGQARVVIEQDADGTPTRLTIAVSKRWLEKDEVRSMPSIKQLAGQLQPKTTEAVA